MLQQLTLRLITTRLFLNFASCIMGFFAWYVISESRTITAEIPLAIYFDNLAPESRIEAPEHTDVTLQGTKNIIQKSRAIGALHFDAKTFLPGRHRILPGPENLLLPTAAKVLNYNPIEITLLSL